MNTKYETYAVDQELKKLEGMDWIKEAFDRDWREIEFKFNDKAFSIRQEIFLEEADDTGYRLATLSTFYMRDSQYHRFGGPAVIQNEGNPNENPKCNFGWAIDGDEYNENEFNFWMACQ